MIVDDAKQLGGEAADIYADGWGESSVAVMESLGRVNQRLVETGVIGEDEVGKIGEAALVVAEVFQTDVTTVIEATSKLMLNGLAPSAEAALDIVAVALQEGGDAAGDLFDSVDEYAPHFAGFGLSAEDMMALFVDGMKNGQRDTDKLGDAVKQMRIRTVDDTDQISAAYEALGLDADEYRSKILEGGPAAKEAFGEIIDAIIAVEDPVEQNRVAVELMGTQIEDTTLEALGSFLAMREGLGETRGKVDEITEGMEENMSKAKELQRTFETVFGAAAEASAGFVLEAISDYQDLGTAIGDVFNPTGARNRQIVEDFEAAEEAAVDMYDAMTDGAESIEEIRERGKEMGAELHTVNAVVVEYADRQAEAAGHTDAAAQRLAEYEKKAEGARMGTADLGKELSGQEGSG